MYFSAVIRLEFFSKSHFVDFITVSNRAEILTYDFTPLQAL